MYISNSTNFPVAFGSRVGVALGSRWVGQMFFFIIFNFAFGAHSRWLFALGMHHNNNLQRKQPQCERETCLVEYRLSA